ncbi:ArsR family transcriptional regulator [Latilactobacillus sakei]|uniref:ArsR family transcriptional regulator n=1 Tax=Latilactobacillus sakei TaxID=1599 RepID=UPI0015F66025|nr:ArsR family transcriptional regulator [Latilactobacillus sakei]MDN4010772.1 ArsR family transcriptional regulator [Latilactobacillus sakei]QMU86169.1 ArsR family transcriptional regulator [Latilactobacillus sakei]UNC20364.1 ArsR family transcriptional regulator [Latilactobacillus sakei]
MSEDLKTIKELADELGLAKQTVQYHLKFLPTENRQKNEELSVNSLLLEQIKDQKRIEEQEKPRKWWGLWRK